jgi:hypothetical protein
LGALHDGGDKGVHAAGARGFVLPVGFADEEGEGDHAEGEDVGGRRDPGANLELLGRHIKRRAQELGGGACGALGDELGDAEVEELDARLAVLALGEEEVSGL